jgi:hypothetical protein
MAIGRQHEFSYRIGVDACVTPAGDDKYRVQGFCCPSVADMATFSIDNVTAANDDA